jgi:hypothetical protein
MKPVPIPESHRDLLDGAFRAALTTLMSDGQLQMTPVWYNREDDYILLNTMRGFRIPHPTPPAQARRQLLRGLRSCGVAGHLRPGQDQGGSHPCPSGRIEQYGRSHS